MMAKNTISKLLQTKSTKPYIYALCDFETLLKKNLTLENFISQAKKYDVKLVQYRDKCSDIAFQEKNIQQLQTALNLPIIVNDRVDLLNVAQGLHLGQEDIEALMQHYHFKTASLLFAFLRKKYPQKLFGISTHNEIEILQANTLPLDYIGLGAYRQTSTKAVSNILGDKISYLAKVSKHPVCAIGGVLKSDVIPNIAFNVIGSNLYD
jgi:thiamine-phosphate pyrophosphorylase